MWRRRCDGAGGANDANAPAAATRRAAQAGYRHKAFARTRAPIAFPHCPVRSHTALAVKARARRVRRQTQGRACVAKALADAALARKTQIPQAPAPNASPVQCVARLDVTRCWRTANGRVR